MTAQEASPEHVAGHNASWLCYCRKLTSLVDKVHAERLKREFKSFRAFMTQLDDSAPAGDASHA